MDHPSVALEKKFGANNYAPLPIVLTKGEGVYVWDDQGKPYLDMMSAYSAVSHGHANPRILQAMIQQAQTLGVTSRAYHNELLGRFFEKLCKITGMGRVLPMNTGAEAVETALKAARKWGYEKKGIAPNQAEIICCTNNFHGRTIAIIGMSSEPQYRQGFGPFPPGLVQVPFGDASALERAITENSCAFILEPIQGEGGIILPPDGYLKACEQICRRHNVLLICDEVQTGLGRTGQWFAHQHENIKPDGLILGKALGGGIYPVSAFVATDAVMSVFRPGDHGSTFGGNPIACAIALEALSILEETDLIANSASLGEYFKKELQKIQSPLIKDVRGRGLFIGIEVDTRIRTARSLCEALLDEGLLSKETHEFLIRLAPPLIITKDQINDAVAIIRRAFS
jgi:ornithine--oxo-acid transaminase